MPRTEQLHQLKLQGVRVLKLINHQVQITTLRTLTHPGVGHQNPVRRHKQVVEIDRVAGLQRALVQCIQVRHFLIQRIGAVGCELIWIDVVVLGTRYLAQYRVNAQVRFRIRDQPFHQLHLVIAIIDRKLRAQSQQLTVTTQEPCSPRVECADLRTLNAWREPRHQRITSRRQLTSRLIRKRHAQRAIRRHTARKDVGHAMRHHTCLPRTRSSNDDQRTLHVRGRRPLHRR